MSKIIRVNTKTKEIKTEIFPEKLYKYGGRGLIDKILTDEVNPKCDALGSENKFIFATGLFAGTSIPTAHRLSVGCKSPLTGGIKESNSGGNFAAYMAHNDIKAIILEDKPEDDELYILYIDANSNVELVPANEYKGFGTYKVVEKATEKYGDKISVAAIGIAGEKQYENSSVQVTDNATGHPARAAARGGVGAVMGSKGIKAVVIDKPITRIKAEPVDNKRFMEAKKAFVDAIMKHPFVGQGMALMGTSAFTDMTGPSGALPVKNFSGEFFPEDKLKKIDSKAYMEKIKTQKGKSGVACQAGCIVRCSSIYCDKNGEFISTGVEYETIALFGPNCYIDDLDAIAEFDRLCDDIGTDTIETGVNVGMFMDAGKLEWGDAEGALNLVREMYTDSENAKILGLGAQKAGEVLGVRRIPAVKGQALAAYDPRNLKGLGVTYAMSTMGADHTAGNPMTIEGYNPYSKDGQTESVAQLMPFNTVCDCMMCLFAFGGATAGGPEVINNTIVEMLNSLYGGGWTLESMYALGVEILLMEKAFNAAAGITAEDDKLPEFFRTDASPATGQVFDVDQDEITNLLNIYGQSTSA